VSTKKFEDPYFEAFNEEDEEENQNTDKINNNN
jgi:hypothetical protein